MEELVIENYKAPTIHKSLYMKSCKSCIHNIDKKKKDCIEPRKYTFKNRVIHETPQSSYANKRCDKKHTLKFGVIECPDFDRATLFPNEPVRIDKAVR